ncbi:MAG TPA: type I methionyl aminopeptidase [Candidatus Cloacimonadota bacterium]|nr:type I methionyl aminopeptidase [Candidatus Cloacimonadota bacterium]HOQ80148.1 type I methionyl aminopeptidase [Candidatus Cloacimonadota bacterium]
MIIIKNKEQIEGVKKASKIAANTLKYVEPFIQEGVNTERLNQLCHDYMIQHDSIPATLNYHGFPKSICTSINNVVCHGIPSEKEILKSGDIVNIDVTAIHNGYYGDCSKTYIIGEAKPEVIDFVKRTENSLNLAIKALRPGNLLSIVGTTIQTYVEQFSYSVVREYGGHGVGVHFHEDPHVSHFYTRDNDIKLKKGMIFTIEPMINLSKNWRVVTCKKDGWTVRTQDKSLSAQFEHTVLITHDSYEILTLPDEG